MVSICCRVAVEEFCTLCTAVCPGLTAALCVCVCVCEGNTGIYCVCVCGGIFLHNAWRAWCLEFPDLLASARESLRLFRQGPPGTIYKSHKQRHVNIVITPSYFQVLGGHVLFLTV